MFGIRRPSIGSQPSTNEANVVPTPEFLARVIEAFENDDPVERGSGSLTVEFDWKVQWVAGMWRNGYMRKGVRTDKMRVTVYWESDGTPIKVQEGDHTMHLDVQTLDLVVNLARKRLPPTA